jgi:hypothetical protein
MLLQQLDKIGVPMVAIFFYKNGHAYHIQVSSRNNLLNKFESFVQSFELLNNRQKYAGV